jgi:putative transposase
MTDTLRQAYEAFRTRDLRGDEVAYLCIDTVYEPLRRWGSKTGVLCVGGICVDGGKVFLTLSTAKSESCERCRDVRRALTMWGLQTPVTSTTDGAPGLIKAGDFVWPQSLRMRCWFHTRQHLMQQVPPQAWPACKARVAALRDAPTFEEGHRRFQALLEQYQGPFPEACWCLAEDAEARLHPLRVGRSWSGTTPSQVWEDLLAVGGSSPVFSSCALGAQRRFRPRSADTSPNATALPL